MTTRKHQETLIALIDRHITACNTFRDTVMVGNTDISKMTAAMSAIRDHVTHKQRPAQKQAELDRLATVAADMLITQNYAPCLRRNEVVWGSQQNGSPLGAATSNPYMHTLIFTYYPDSPCVRLSLDYSVAFVTARQARVLGLNEYNMRGYTTVKPYAQKPLELTTLPEEMTPEVIAWALGERSAGDCPIALEQSFGGGNNIWSAAAVAAYKASL